MAEPNVFTAIWNHRILVLACVGVFVGLGVLVTSMRPAQYAARAEVVLENPRATPLAESRARDEARYVASQVSVLKSTAVAERASAVARMDENPKSIDPRQIQRNTTIGASGDSNFVVIRFRARDPETAQVGANAIVQAYREIVREDLDTKTAAALDRIDDAIAATVRALSESGSSGLQNETATALLRELRARRSTLQADARLAGDGVALSSPAELGRRYGPSLVSALLVAVVLGGLLGGGVAYALDSRVKEPTSRLTPRLLITAPTLVEIPDFRRERLSSKLPALDAPGSEAADAFRLLATIVALRREPAEGSVGAKFAESLQDEFPGLSEREVAVLDRVAIRLDELMLEVQKPTRSRKKDTRSITHRSVAFVSASPGDGTTTLAANTALAAAKAGDRVLMLDGDLVGRGLTRLLLGDQVARIAGTDGRAVGFTDMLMRGLLSEGIRRLIETSRGGSLSMIEPGSITLEAMNAIRTELIRVGLDSTQELFDRIFVDVPPPAQFPHADTLLKSVDAVVVVVPYRRDPSVLEELLDRFDLLGIRPIGLVRNFVPPHHAAGHEMAQTMLDRVVDRVERLTSQLVRAGTTRLAPVPEPYEEDGQEVEPAEPAEPAVAALEPVGEEPSPPKRSERRRSTSA